MYIFEGLLLLPGSQVVPWIMYLLWVPEGAGFRVVWVDVDVLGGGEVHWCYIFQGLTRRDNSRLTIVTPLLTSSSYLPTSPQEQ